MRLLLFFKCSTLGLFNARFNQSSITCSLRSAASQTHHQLRSLFTKLDSCFRQLLPLFSYLFLKLTKRTCLLIELGWCDVISIIANGWSGHRYHYQKPLTSSAQLTKKYPYGDYAQWYQKRNLARI